MKLLPRQIAHALLLALALATGACAHYGWADRGREDETRSGSDRPVAVATLMAEAHLGLNLAVLTGHLVEMLRRDGLSAVAWNGGGGRAVEVLCRVEDAHMSGFGAHLSAGATVSCSVVEDSLELERVRARGLSSRAHSQGATASLLQTHQGLEEEAVLDALSRLSPQLARLIAKNEYVNGDFENE